MAYLTVKRLYKEEIVEISSARMKMREAKNLMKFLSGLEAAEDKSSGLHGELWIEVEDETRDLVIDPVVFHPHDALRVLFSIGMSAVDAAIITTDAHSKSVLAEYYASNGRVFNDE